MIYNLSKYISDNSAVVPITNGYDASSSEPSVSLIKTGGEDASRGLKIDDTIQILSRASDRVIAYELIQVVYNLLKNRYWITLPEVTVNGIVYPAIDTFRIVPIQTPGYVGADGNGFHQWSVNLQITTEE